MATSLTRVLSSSRLRAPAALAAARRLPAAPLLFLLAALLVHATVLLHAASAWIGEGGDARIAVWYLGWIADSVAHGHSPLITDYLHYPDSINVMWNASVLLPGLLLTPVTLLAGPIAAYNVLVVGAVTLSSWTAYLALRRYVALAPAAWLGGALYGFSPFMVNASLGQVHMLLLWLPPLTLLLLDEALVRRRWSVRRTGTLLGAAAALQVVVAEEVLAITVIGAAAGLAILALQHRHRVAERLGRLLRTAGVAAVVFAVLAAAPLALQFLGPGRPTAALFPGDWQVADAAGFVVPTAHQWIAPDAVRSLAPHFAAGIPEAPDNYLGLPLLLFVVGALALLLRNAAVRFAAALGTVMAVLAMGQHLHRDAAITNVVLPWRLADSLPLLADLVPARLIVVTWLMAGLIVAVVVDQLLVHPTDSAPAGTPRASPRRRAVLGGLALTLALAPVVPALPLPDFTPATPAYFSSAAVEAIPEGAPVLVLPFTPVFGELAMSWQAEAHYRFRLLGGNAFSERPAAALGQPSSLKAVVVDIEVAGRWHDVLDTATRAALLGDLRRDHVAAVVLGPCPNEAHLLATFTDLLGPATQVEGGVHTWLLGPG